MSHSRNHCCHVKATVPSIFIVVGADFAGNNIKVFCVSIEMQLLSSNKLFRTAVNNNRYYTKNVQQCFGFNSFAAIFFTVRLNIKLLVAEQYSLPTLCIPVISLADSGWLNGNIL
jgi:hypothetical protein